MKNNNYYKYKCNKYKRLCGQLGGSHEDNMEPYYISLDKNHKIKLFELIKQDPDLEDIVYMSHTITSISDNKVYLQLGHMSDVVDVVNKLVLGNKHLIGMVPATINNLSQLAHLDLSNNQFTGTIIDNINSLTGLGYLNLSNNQFTGNMFNIFLYVNYYFRTLRTFKNIWWKKECKTE